MQELLAVDEYFQYSVQYGFFRLGTIDVWIEKDSLYKGQRTHLLRTVIRSNPAIPFVGNEENHYSSLMVATDTLPHSMIFWTDNVDEEIYRETEYIFDRERDSVYTFEEHEPVNTIELEEPASSGHIMFYLSRLFPGADTSFRVPVYIEHEKGFLRAGGNNRVEKREYKAFEQPIPTYKLTGYANVDGPFGFSGHFTSFFSTDDLRVPLEARVKVWIGSVTVKLINYERR